MKKYAILIAALTSIGCGGNSDGDPQLTVRLSNLETLGDGYVYEGWLITPDGPVSAGRFNIDSDGEPTETSFDALQVDLDAATKYVLTIEPEPDSDPTPTDTHVVAGDFVNGIAALSVGDGDALGTDFASATGTYFLAVPTDTGEVASFENGIWWIDATDAPPPVAGLSLPTLPAGWTYEGWVVDADGPVSTGKFLTGNGADSDGAGALAGLGDAPLYPGQDFVTTPRALNIGHTAVISVEPSPDDSAVPFAIKPLVHPIEDLGKMVQQQMNLNVGALPEGTASF